MEKNQNRQKRHSDTNSKSSEKTSEKTSAKTSEKTSEKTSAKTSEQSQQKQSQQKQTVPVSMTLNLSALSEMPNLSVPEQKQTEKSSETVPDLKRKNQTDKAKREIKIHFPYVGVWNRSLFKHVQKYCMMQKINGIRRKIQNEEYVFDCEELNGKLIILDCFRAFSKIINNFPFMERLKFAEKFIKNRKMENFEVIQAKPIRSIKELFEELNKTETQDLVDGLVLRNLKDSFQSSRVYKLKTSKMSTIDFHLVDGKLFTSPNSPEKNSSGNQTGSEKIESEKNSKTEIPFWFPLLNNSDTFRNEKLHPENYTKEQIEEIEKLKKQDLNGKIIEMTWDGFSWQPLRIRNDKFFPNRSEFALSNAENIYFPLRLENAFFEIEDVWISQKEFTISDRKEDETFELFRDDLEELFRDNSERKPKIIGSKGFKLELFKRFGLF